LQLHALEMLLALANILRIYLDPMNIFSSSSNMLLREWYICMILFTCFTEGVRNHYYFYKEYTALSKVVIATKTNKRD